MKSNMRRLKKGRHRRLRGLRFPSRLAHTHCSHLIVPFEERRYHFITFLWSSCIANEAARLRVCLLRWTKLSWISQSELALSESTRFLRPSLRDESQVRRRALAKAGGMSKKSNRPGRGCPRWSSPKKQQQAGKITIQYQNLLEHRIACRWRRFKEKLACYIRNADMTPEQKLVEMKKKFRWISAMSANACWPNPSQAKLPRFWLFCFARNTQTIYLFPFFCYSFLMFFSEF